MPKRYRVVHLALGCIIFFAAFLLLFEPLQATASMAAASEPMPEAGTLGEPGRERPDEDREPGEEDPGWDDPVAGQSTAPADPLASDQGPGLSMAVISAAASGYSGAATCEVPIVVAPGRCAMAPTLTLTYNSSGGKGWLGVGWALDLGAIQRSAKHGLNYAAQDFAALRQGAAAELTPRPEWGEGSYGERVEAAFSKYRRNPSSGGWEMTSRDGLRYFYGSSSASRQENGYGVFKWCLDRVEDPNGNFMTACYIKNQGEIYLSRIEYTGNKDLTPSNRVEFLTEARPDVPVSYHTHTRTITALRLKAILVYSGGLLSRRYDLGYETEGAASPSRLVSITQYGSDGTTALPPTRFQWQNGGAGWVALERLNDFGFGAYPNTGIAEGWEYGVHIDYYDRYPLFSGDWNGDGRTDVGRATCSGATLYVSEPDGRWRPIDAVVDDRIGNCALWEGGKWPVLTGDFNGDGKTDIGRVNDQGVRIYLADGEGRWVRYVDLADFGAAAYPYWGANPLFTGDFDGDGQSDIGRVTAGGIQFYCSDASNGWRPYPAIEGDLSPQQGYASSSEYPVVIGDFNGDGRSDVGRVSTAGMVFFFSDEKAGWRRMPDLGDFGRNAGYLNAAAYPIFVGDFNGDGQSDIGRVRESGVRFLLSKGDGGWECLADLNDLGITQGYKNAGEYPMIMGDFNGDGRSDVGRVGERGVTFYLSNGDGGWKAGQPINNFSKAQYYSSTQRYPILAGDFNGDGKTDVGRVDQSAVGFYAAAGPAPDLLVKLSGTMGGSTTLAYTPSSTYPNTRLPVNIQTVASITQDDGQGNLSTTRYTYSGGYFDAPEREFRGFARAKQTCPDGTSTETSFHQDAFLKGRAQTSILREPGAGRVLRQETLEWEKEFLDAKQTCAFVRLALKQGWSYDYDGGQTYEVWTEEGHAYDSCNGNPVFSWQKGTGGPTLIRQRAYTNCGHWLWCLTEESLQSESYALLRKTTCGYATGTGNLLWKEAWLEGGQGPRVTYGYDSYGNLTSVTDPAGFSITTAYDTTTRTFPIKVTRPRTGIVTHVEEKGYDNRFGAVSWEKDENGQITRYTYDPLGRLIQTDYPDGGQVKIFRAFDTFPRYISTSALENTTGTRQDAYEIFDGLGRTIRKVTFGAGNKLIVSACQYDAMGRNVFTAGPYYTPDGSFPDAYPYVRTAYDDRGRPLWVVTQDGDHGEIATACTYQGPAATTWGPDGTGKTIREDYLGRVTEGIEHADEGYFHTCYTYNEAGDLLKITDQEGAQAVLQYDSLGRKTTMRDPDMGCWRYSYDANGNLRSQTDARGITTTFTYDALNRVLTRSYSNGEAAVVYTYDDTKIPNGRGRPRKISRGGTATLYEGYDPMGRPLGVTRDAGGVRGTTWYGYDLGGKPTAMTYPDGCRVDYVYHPGIGWPAAVTAADGRVYACLSGYTAAGQPGRILYGNGTTTERRYDPLLGRFISPDSIVPKLDAQTLNRYSYCRNNPLSYVDPSGHFFQLVVGAMIGAVIAGSQNGWNLGSMMTGAFVGEVSGGVFTAAEGAAATALKNVVSQAAVRGCLSGAAGGAAAGGAARWLSGEICGGDPLDGQLSGAGYGALSGGAFGGIGGHYGSRWDRGRVLLHTIAGGGVTTLSGGDFFTGGAWTGGVALLTYSATLMRAQMIAQSKLDSRNASGVSAGHKGDGFKLAGGRFNPQEPQGREIFGGAQGGPGYFFNSPYQPGSWQDLLCEAYAGPHDFLKSGYLYNTNGNIRVNMPQIQMNIGDCLAFSNLFVATPFVLADSVPPSLFNILYH